MKTVAILDGQTIQTLPVAKRLKELGFYTLLLCDQKSTYGFHTKYGDKKILVPSTKNEVDKFHKFFMELVLKERIDVVVPMNDYSAHYLSFHKEELLNYTKFIIPDYEIFMAGYDKNLLMEVCSKNGFPHPKTHSLSIDVVEQAARCVRFPALIKPNITTGARGFSFINSVSDILEKLPEIQENYGECHLQEYIAPGGRQFKVEIFIKDSEVINSTVIHKIRFYPKMGGSSCFNQTVLEPKLVSMCSEVLKILKWEGFADFDLIEDPKDGSVKIMEINPRVPACIKSSLESGVDFIENIVNCSLGFPGIKNTYKPGNFLRYFGLDLLWLIKSSNRVKLLPIWFKEINNPKHKFQDGSFDDIKPFVFGTLGGLIKQLDPRFRAAKKAMN